MSDVLVVGGGLAGSASAIALAQAGRDVILVEKEQFAHDKVCGEFLSAEALHYLQALGVDAGALGAVEIAAVRMVRGERVVERALPFAAMSLSRRVLDDALLERAIRAGVRVMRGRRVESVLRDGDGWEAVLDGGERVGGREIFLCCGKHDVRGRARAAGIQNDLVAFKMHWRLSAEQHAALGSRVELILFDSGYGGLEPVEDRVANLCVLVRRGRLKELCGWAELLAAMREECAWLNARLRGAEAVWERPLALSAIPYGYVRADAGDGIWRLGDQAAVIPSFSGDGMSIALHSAAVAAAFYLRGRDAETYQRAIYSDVRLQVAVATAVSRGLVGAPGVVTGVVRAVPVIMDRVAGATRIKGDAVCRGLASERAGAMYAET